MYSEFSISVTESALAKLTSIMKEESDTSLLLRVFVTGGGCSGLQYGLTFEDNSSPNDIEVVHGDVKFLIDEISSIYLNGANIDLREEIMGTNIVINSPNAVTSCGCGNSA